MTLIKQLNLNVENVVTGCVSLWTPGLPCLLKDFNLTVDLNLIWSYPVDTLAMYRVLNLWGLTPETAIRVNTNLHRGGLRLSLKVKPKG